MVGLHDAAVPGSDQQPKLSTYRTWTLRRSLRSLRRSRSSSAGQDCRSRSRTCLRGQRVRSDLLPWVLNRSGDPADLWAGKSRCSPTCVCTDVTTAAASVVISVGQHGHIDCHMPDCRRRLDPLNDRTRSDRARTAAETRAGLSWLAAVKLRSSQPYFQKSCRVAELRFGTCTRQTQGV